MLDYFIATITHLIDKNPMLYIGILILIFASLAGLKIMKLNLIIHKNMRLPLFFTGIGFILLGVYVKVPASYFSTVEASDNQSSTMRIEKKVFTEKEISKQVEAYFDALESHNFASVSPFYAKTLEDFMGEKNIASNKVKKTLANLWSKISKENYKTTAGSWKHSKDNFDNYSVSFNFNYYCTLKNKQEEEPPIYYKGEIKFDKDLKLIVYRQTKDADTANQKNNKQ